MTLSRTKSTAQRNRQGTGLDLTYPGPENSSASSVDLEAITAEPSKESTTKKSKSLRVERQLLSKTEELREQTNLNFSEYVETALRHFNDYLDQHLSAQSRQTDDAA